MSCALSSHFGAMRGGSWRNIEIDPGFAWQNVEALFQVVMKLRGASVTQW